MVDYVIMVKVSLCSHPLFYLFLLLNASLVPSTVLSLCTLCCHSFYLFHNATFSLCNPCCCFFYLFHSFSFFLYSQQLIHLLVSSSLYFCIPSGCTIFILYSQMLLFHPVVSLLLLCLMGHFFSCSLLLYFLFVIPVAALFCIHCFCFFLLVPHYSSFSWHYLLLLCLCTSTFLSFCISYCCLNPMIFGNP